MNLIFENDINTISIVQLVFFILCGLGFGYVEYTKKFQLSYSKFNSTGNIDSKKGMFFIYFIPLLTYLFSYMMLDFTPTLYHKIIFYSVIFHFGKRCMEVLFLHKFSGKLSLITMLLITWAYSSISFTIHQSVNLLTTPMMLEKESFQFTLGLGFFLFALGQGINFYHHIILSKLRTGDTKEYKVPIGGLFKYVSCPHYFGEIIGWLGIAILSKYLVVYGLFFIMTSYLTARSINTSKWYREKIPNYPENRKSIFPFLI